MVGALVNPPAFRILDEGVTATTEAIVEIRGTFESDSKGDLWVPATMTDAAGHTVQSVAETHVSRTAFPSTLL